MNALSSPHELHLVIDDGGLNHLLFDSLSQQGYHTLLLPISSDLQSVQRAADRADNGTPWTAIHLYSHGQPGRLALGGAALDAAALRREAPAWRKLGQLLQPGGDLLLYGCNLAEGERGRRWVDQLAARSGVDVAASIDASGAGGNWVLEYDAGPVETSPPDLLTGLAWPGQLSTLSQPVHVPLHWVDLNSSGEGQRKLGIYASLGGSRQPQLFELDTGGAGFYAVYGDNSPWWGPRVRSRAIPFQQTYDSGMTYTGTAVNSTVELFANRSARSSRLKLHNIVVGQTTRIDDGRHDRAATLWPESSGDITPPVSNRFYGDFGLATKQGQHQIDSLAAQLRYGPGVTPGYRVHATAQKPWVQFGLSPKDLTLTATSFQLHQAEGRKPSPTGVPYYHPYPIKGSLEIEANTRDGQRRFFRQPTGILLDTGASTSIHRDGQTSIPAVLTQNGKGLAIAKGATVTARSPSLNPARRGKDATVLQAQAGSKDDPPGFSTQVAIKDTGAFYLNTGIRPFLTHDVIVNLADGELTLLPRQKKTTR